MTCGLPHPSRIRIANRQRREASVPRRRGCSGRYIAAMPPSRRPRTPRPHRGSPNPCHSIRSAGRPDRELLPHPQAAIFASTPSSRDNSARTGRASAAERPNNWCSARVSTGIVRRDRRGLRLCGLPHEATRILASSLGCGSLARALHAGSFFNGSDILGRLAVLTLKTEGRRRDRASPPPPEFLPPASVTCAAHLLVLQARPHIVRPRTMEGKQQTEPPLGNFSSTPPAAY